jgi:hypothetical protein
MLTDRTASKGGVRASRSGPRARRAEVRTQQVASLRWDFDSEAVLSAAAELDRWVLIEWVSIDHLQGAASGAPPRARTTGDLRLPESIAHVVNVA